MRDLTLTHWALLGSIALMLALAVGWEFCS